MYVLLRKDTQAISEIKQNAKGHLFTSLAVGLILKYKEQPRLLHNS